jgi:signal transduction histidine kinase
MLNESPDPKDHINLALEVRLEVEALKNSEVIRAKEIDLVLDDSVQRTIDASLSRPELKRILQNLIHNSVDASEARSRIEVGVFRDGDQAVVSVRDYGHGIPEHLQKKVFQPDFTLKPGTGTGLGLAILKYIASARRGAIELVSTSAGTLIEVKIPIFSGKGAMSCPIES